MKITNDNFMQMTKKENFVFVLMFLLLLRLSPATAHDSFLFINFNENYMQTIFRPLLFVPHSENCFFIVDSEARRRSSDEASHKSDAP